MGMDRRRTYNGYEEGLYLQYMYFTRRQTYNRSSCRLPRRHQSFEAFSWSKLAMFLGKFVFVPGLHEEAVLY